MEIKIINHKGEIENGHSCNHTFTGVFSEQNKNKIEVIFYVNIHVIDKETNSILRTEKLFKTKEDAIYFLKKFIDKKPLSEAIIIEKTTKEILHYA